MLNRNLAHSDQGYLHCLDQVARLGQNHWLINEHIPHVFRFSSRELKFLQTAYQQRVQMLRKLCPWDDPNYAIDEHWAVFYPYGLKARSGTTAELQVRVTNHSPKSRTFRVTRHSTWDIRPVPDHLSVTLQPNTTASVPVRVRVPNKSGVWIVTADIESDGMHFLDWAEAIITVE